VIISHKQKFVMLATWKAASQTLRKRLRDYNESPYSRLYDFNPHLNRVVHHQHMTCAEFRSLPEARLGYFVGAFVRNPYDRVYSGFRQLQLDARVMPRLPFPQPWIRDLVTRQITDNLSQLMEARFEFDAWLGLLRDEQILEVGRNTSFLLHPAHYWTHVAGERAVDFLGRVEHFEADFSRFLAVFGIELGRQRNANVSDLDGDAGSNTHGYRYVTRMEPRSRARINDLFRQDFEFLGYEKVV
jgi:hypothetical protein